MSRSLYLDECVNHRLAQRQRELGVDVTSAVDEGTLGYDDESQLLVAAELGRIIDTHNLRHFQRLHAQFLAEARSHAGIMLVPHGPLSLVSLRVTMLLAWIEGWDEVIGRMIRWHDLQGELTRGARLEGFTESETRQALALDPIDASPGS